MSTSPKPLNPRLLAVTERIRDRSRSERSSYLGRMKAESAGGPTRARLSCTNLAHGFAAASTGDKDALKDLRWPNLAIVTAYNDMLSAHQPFEGYPGLIRVAARDAGATAQVAGGVPAMCDGVTQGHAGLELFGKLLLREGFFHRAALLQESAGSSWPGWDLGFLSIELHRRKLIEHI